MARTSQKNLADDARKIAEAQAAKDAELMASLQSRKGKQAPPPTLGDNFIAAAALIQQAHKGTRIAHVNLVKIWELTLMWELNTRNNPQRPPIFSPEDLQEIGGSVEESAPDEGAPTTADEMIGEFTELPVEGN